MARACSEEKKEAREARNAKEGEIKRTEGQGRGALRFHKSSATREREREFYLENLAFVRELPHFFWFPFFYGQAEIYAALGRVIARYFRGISATGRAAPRARAYVRRVCMRGEIKAGVDEWLNEALFRSWM